MSASTLKLIVTRLLVTLLLVILGTWLLRETWLERKVHNKDYSFTAAEAEGLGSFPRAQYEYGLKAWYLSDAESAARFFRRALKNDPLFVDAWLKLAEAEASMGHQAKAREILAFVNGLTSRVLKWKWQEALLARELGTEGIFLHNVNTLITRGSQVQNAFQLLDIHYENSVERTIQSLDPPNLVPYLEWLIRWDRDEGALLVWPKIVANGPAGDELVLKYVNFLVSKRHIVEARAVWQEHTRINGMTNPGFEQESSQLGFDWRYRPDKNRRWEIRRVQTTGGFGSHALRVSFRGLENISFGHVYQIVPVEPLKAYRLTYRWKGQDITTDQGPFVDVYGYDRKGLYVKGPMITGDRGWAAEAIEFTPPADCHAVVVRLSRRPSRRFDCKIEGTVWLDDFELKPFD